MSEAHARELAKQSDWPFAVKPLHPAFGCEIIGITLAQAVEEKAFAKIHEAFLQYELILFRNVDLPPATQVTFAHCFGEVKCRSTRCISIMVTGTLRSTCCRTWTPRAALMAAIPTREPSIGIPTGLGVSAVVLPR